MVRNKNKIVHLRFYEELNDFLTSSKRKIRYDLNFTGSPSIKDVIESQGIPHTEVDMILINGKSVGFDIKIENDDDVSVYPVFESFDIGNIQRLRPAPLRNPKFVLDVHLGTLARYMRMLGFDTKYQNYFTDYQIISISVKENRTILTRDLGILKHSDVTHGYWIRNTKPVKQIEEVVGRFNLRNNIDEFSRCIICNSKLNTVDKEKIIDRIPEKVKELHDEFFICRECDKIYWKGTHYTKMKSIINRLKSDSSNDI